MDYERIHKPQTGVISPSKLRMKLMGPKHLRKKDESKCNSSRTSPTKLEDAEFVKNSLLASNGGDLDEEVAATSLGVPSLQVSSEAVSETSQGDPIFRLSKEPLQMRIIEDENFYYDNNANSSSFEFDEGERSSSQSQFTRSFPRPVPSKWNDAEKWIISRRILQPNYPNKNALHDQTNPLSVPNMGVRVAPEASYCDHNSSSVRVAETKRVDLAQPAMQMALEKFSFVPPRSHPISGQSAGGSACGDLDHPSEDLNEVGHMEWNFTRSSAEDASVVSTIRAVSMRDMGTEMTPVPSQEPSRSATPVGATTPLRSPTSSIPSTPGRGAPAPGMTTDEETRHPIVPSKRESSEHELKTKTWREILDLGIQLGKMSIADRASKNVPEKNVSTADTEEQELELERVEFEKRAAEWEEAEKSKHAARYKREEIKIQAWQHQQNAKLEAKMQRIEARLEQTRAQASAKMVKRIAMARQRREEKRAAAEAKRYQEAEKTAAEAEYIRQTGRMPSTPFMCCSWLS